MYSMPHFSFTITGLPVRPFRNGFGFSGKLYSRYGEALTLVVVTFLFRHFQCLLYTALDARPIEIFYMRLLTFPLGSTNCAK